MRLYTAIGVGAIGAGTVDGYAIGSNGASNGAGGYSVKHEGKIYRFRNKQEALRFIERLQDEPEPEQETATVSTEVVAESSEPVSAPAIPQKVVDVEALRLAFERANQLREYDRLMRRMRYDALIKLYEQMLDEEEIETLLLAA